MWIRSQDKEMLLNCECFDILDEDTIWIIYGCNTTLATYSTEEKALKVLDMIENHIENMYIGIGNYMGKPFQMPKEEDVDNDE